MKNQDVFLLEDEKDIRDLLKKALEREGLSVQGFERGELLLDELTQTKPKMMVVDRCLPGMDGLSVIKEVRKNHSDIRIMVLSALESPEEIVAGLEAGADDYIKKTTSIFEVSARITFALKKIRSENESISLNIETRELNVGSERVKLTPREFEILEMLFRQPGIAVSSETILEALSKSAKIEESNLAVHVHSLRKKIKAFELEIESLRGVGYRLNKKGAA